ncbi:MAG: AIPR family protein [Defluviitaleaceae bacterium]|nr:AIPR family protein [Defluviitaleaceae bacterium]
MKIIYVSRGNAEQVDSNIKGTGEKIVSTCTSLLSCARITMDFWGAKELIEKFRDKRTGTFSLKIAKHFTFNDNYVVLMKLSDYYDFITDKETGGLRRYLFDSNVRDYMGNNRTNLDIIETLQNSNSPDFWLLNNGITMITSKATVIGNEIEAENVQIVNGLQTTISLYNHFCNGNIEESHGNILVKIIETADSDVSKQIIRATNNQTSIPAYALYANDKIQKDIEDVMLKSHLYYERRPGYYLNLGHEREKIITPMYLGTVK